MTNDKKCLIIVSPGFPSDENDSTCLPAQQIFVESLHRLYPAISIIVVAFQYPFIKKTYSWKGIEVISLGGKNKGRLRRLLVWINAWRAFKKINREYIVMGLFSFWCSECAFIAGKFARRHQLLHLIWVSGQDARLSNKFVRWIKPHPRELIAMSDFLQKQFYINHAIRPSYVIPNGVNTEQFHPNHQPKNIEILGVGSLIPLKQYNIFIEVVEVLRVQFPGIRCSICGKGPEEKALKEMILKKGLQENIVFEGEREHSEAIAFMQRAKIFLHPSSYEGLSSACLEALYAGAHVISFCHPGNAWIRNWHIAANTEHMIKLAGHILSDPSTIYEPSLPFRMEDSAREILRLFNQQF